MSNNKKYDLKNKINSIITYFKIKNSKSNKKISDKKIKNNYNNFKDSLKYFINLIKYYIYKIILRKNIKKPTKSDNIIISILSSFFFALLISIFLFFILKFSVSEKQSYGDYNITKIDEHATNKSIDNKQENPEEKNTVVERVSSTAIDEEISAQSSYKYATYTFNVDRTISTKEKVHIFNTANWYDFSSILPEGTKFNVNFMTSPGGYMMYQIKDGEYAGKFITANNNLVNIDNKNDNINTEFINKPIAIKILENTSSYTSKDLKNIKALVYKGVVLNINGLGVSNNNRLIYHVSDGSFIVIDNSKTLETDRKSIPKNEKKEDKLSSKNRTNNKNNQNNQNNNIR